MPPKNKTQKHQKCPPEICPTGKCPERTTWNVKTQKCLVKPYNEWGVKKDIDNGIRKLPEDLRYIVGEEAYKKEYEDEAVKRGETIVLVPARKNVQAAAIQKLPPPPPVSAVPVSVVPVSVSIGAAQLAEPSLVTTVARKVPERVPSGDCVVTLFSATFSNEPEMVVPVVLGHWPTRMAPPLRP